MNRAELLFLTPYLVSLLVLVGLFLYAVRNRYILGAKAFAWLIGGQFLVTLGFILELVSPTLRTKLGWDTFQWLVTAFLVILPFLVFAVEYTGTRPGSSLWGITLTFLGIFATVLLTDNLHHLFYQNPSLTPEGPFQWLTYDFTYVIFIYMLLYVYGAHLYGIILLIRRALQPETAFRGQYLLIAVGFSIPLVFSLLPLVDMRLASYRDVTPLAYAAGSLVAAWGLFRYGLFDIAYIASEHLMDSLPDPVIVLDARNRILDMNKAALTFLGKQKSGSIGRPLEVVFSNWHPLLKVVKDPLMSSQEVSVIGEAGASTFNLKSSQILGRKREVIGRIVTIRDVTNIKTLESEYGAVSRELEQRIQARTEELHNRAEHYQSIVEHHADFIVRWKPDGTRTFVNEAYCRYWGITQEQALARNFLFHLPEEDRPDVEIKIVRLNAGFSEVETEVHRVIKPDGDLAWLEWKDKAIRDVWGNLVEIQSTGRDITGRQIDQTPREGDKARYNRGEV